jgi:hypothetical protein
MVTGCSNRHNFFCPTVRYHWKGDLATGAWTGTQWCIFQPEDFMFFKPAGDARNHPRPLTYSVSWQMTLSRSVLGGDLILSPLSHHIKPPHPFHLLTDELPSSTIITYCLITELFQPSYLLTLHLAYKFLISYESPVNFFLLSWMSHSTLQSLSHTSHTTSYQWTIPPLDQRTIPFITSPSQWTICILLNYEWAIPLIPSPNK